MSRVVLLGSDHPTRGEIAVRGLGNALAVGTTAGVARNETRFSQPNEDAAAVVAGANADLLVVADAHYGALASQTVVERVVYALGSEPPPADLRGEELEALVYEVGRAIGDSDSSNRAGAPLNRATLALALVTADRLQWASFGDSLVLISDGNSTHLVSTPRTTYLGSGFVRAEVSSLLEQGIRAREPGEYVVLATDGIRATAGPGLGSIASALRTHADAASCVHAILSRTLAEGGRDAASVVVAMPS